MTPEPIDVERVQLPPSGWLRVWEIRTDDGAVVGYDFQAEEA